MSRLSNLLPNSRRAAKPKAEAAEAEAAEAEAAEEQAEDDEEEEQAEAAEAEAAEEQAEDDEEDEQLADDEQAKAARGREKSRIAKILRSDDAKGRAATALTLALDTDLKSAEAIKVLAATPKGSGRGDLAERMSQVKPPKVGPAGGGGSDPGTSLVEACRARGKALVERRT